MSSYSQYRIPYSRYFRYINHSHSRTPQETEWECRVTGEDGKECGKVVDKRQRIMHLKTAHSEIFLEEVEPNRKTWLSKVAGRSPQ